MLGVISDNEGIFGSVLLENLFCVVLSVSSEISTIGKRDVGFAKPCTSSCGVANPASCASSSGECEAVGGV